MTSYKEWFILASWYLPNKKNYKASKYNVMWFPQSYKVALGIKDVGFDVYYMHNLGEYNNNQRSKKN